MKSTFFLASLMSTPWAMQSEVLTAYAKTIARQYGDKFAAVRYRRRTYPHSSQGQGRRVQRDARRLRSANTVHTQ